MSQASRRHRRLIATLVFTSFLLGLIALALGNANLGIAITALVSVAALATVFHFTLPGSAFFSAVFANSIGIYACVYVFFITQNFDKVSSGPQEIGFILPLIGFLIGGLWRRREIAASVGSEKTDLPRDFWHTLTWIPPLIAVGAASFIMPLRDFSAEDQDMVLLGAMTVVALTALLAVRDIAAFLLDTAILFEDFFANAARLAKPAFAFLTCYSLLTLIFGCLYTILDRFSAVPNFLVRGESKYISFIDGLYLSVVTLSTVGYGDLTAVSPIARIVVAAEIFSGVLLLLFGVQAILTSEKK